MHNDGKQATSETIYTLVDYEDPYVQPLLERAISKLASPPLQIEPIKLFSNLPLPTSPCLIWRQYESLPFEALSSSPRLLVNAYVFRKALIRKHYLSTVVRNWLVKYPTSVLKDHVQTTEDFTVDYAQFLDDALVECYDLKESDERNDVLKCNGAPASERQWWILKPGMAERGKGIRLFENLEQLQEIFDGWDPESDDEDEAAGSDNGDVGTNGDTDQVAEKDEAMVTGQWRYFVVQKYIANPLLFSAPFESGGRKFHVRTYVVCAGALKVFVYRRMLALFAGQQYRPPWEAQDANVALSAHLTNTCLQSGEREGSVHDFWSLPADASGLSTDWKDSAFKQICAVTGEVFKAAAQGMSMHFQPLPNAFEIFGLDFLVDSNGASWLLEVNAFPDFAQTGSELQDLVSGLFEGVVDVAIRPFFETAVRTQHGTTTDMIDVLDLDLGRR